MTRLSSMCVSNEIEKKNSISRSRETCVDIFLFPVSLQFFGKGHCRLFFMKKLLDVVEFG